MGVSEGPVSYAFGMSRGCCAINESITVEPETCDAAHHAREILVLSCRFECDQTPTAKIDEIMRQARPL